MPAMCTVVRTTSREAELDRTRLSGWGISRGVVAMLLIATTSGCYNYVPVSHSLPAPTTYLAVRLTDPGSALLTGYLGPDVRVVRGRFVRTDERAFVISVSSVESRRGDSYAWQGEAVSVPSEFVWTMEERHPARTKTALLALAAITSFFGVYAAFTPGASGTSPSGGGQGPSPH
ncbi:MAG TPA: hypothetical protein VH439_09505 [Gemmatimonadales bacterium]|jgi:hypothetical protein